MAHRRLMGFYLYCIGAAGHPAPPADLAGIDGAPVAGRVAPQPEDAPAPAALVAWVSPLDAAPKPSLAAVRAHNAVVERACEERTALPVRFGHWFPEARELDDSLTGRRDALAGALRRVEGALEMGIRITDPAHDEVAPDRSTGRAYLETLARREGRSREARERGEAVAAALLEWLGGLVREAHVRPVGTADGLAAVACLVARHDIGGYLERAREFPARYEHLRFHFSGPWPPYGFTDDSVG